MKKKDGTFSQCTVHVVHPCKINLCFIELFIYHLFNIYLFNEFSWTSYSSFLFKIQPYQFSNQRYNNFMFIHLKGKNILGSTCTARLSLKF